MKKKVSIIIFVIMLIRSSAIYRFMAPRTDTFKEIDVDYTMAFTMEYSFNCANEYLNYSALK